MDIEAMSPPMKSRPALPLLAALWATVVGLYLLIAATYDRSVAILELHQSAYQIVKNKLLDYASPVAVTDFKSASGLFFPALLALPPLAFRKYRRGVLLVAGILTLGICLVWPLSIGVLYLPGALLLLFAAVRTSGARG